MKPRPPDTGLVYSTDAGRMCPACRKPVAACTCAATAAASAPATDGVVRVGRETKGRGGKTVTLVRGLVLGPDALGRLAKQLKATCGAGGSVRDGVIEIQGEHCDKVVAALKLQGLVVKRAGG